MEKRAEEVFTEEVIEIMRSAIAANSNHEVFFTGYTGEESKKVEDAEAVVYGNESMTPVFLEKALSCDVVIHNHPSGVLTPSDPDLQMADTLMNQAGVGFLIIDNAVTRVKIVFYAPGIQGKEKKLLNPQELVSLFEKGGKIASKLSHFERRTSQESMIGIIAEAFNKNEAAVIEAGTGTGKSIAYLIPSIYWAVSNKEKVIVSTYTKNLQEQIYSKDLAFLKKCLEIDFSYALVKGKSNYVCRKRFEETYEGLKDLSESGLFSMEDGERLKVFESLKTWIEKTEDGDIEELSYEMSRVIGEDIRASTDLCLHRKCPFFASCFVNKVKQKIFTSDIIVVNHHYLLAELSMEFEEIPHRILPNFTKIIVDEAHNFKKAAYSYLEDEGSFLGILKFSSRIYNSGRRGKAGELNLLIRFLGEEGSKTADTILSKIKEEAIPFAENLKKKINSFFEILKDKVNQTLKGSESHIRLKGDSKNFEPLLTLYDNIKTTADAYKTLIDEILKYTRLLPEKFKTDNQILIKSIDRNTRYLKDNIALFQNLFIAIPDEAAVWIALNRKNDNLSIHRLNLDKTVFFQQTLFKEEYSVIFTSATLSVAGKFKQFSDEIGLDDTVEKKRVEKILASPFDYEKQVKIFIPTDISSPFGSDSLQSPFIKNAFPMIKNLIDASKGGVFVLCTSFWQVREIKNFLEKQQLRYPLFIHGEENRAKLVSDFKKAGNGVLLGTDSFWEGVDIQGEDLRMVIILKLPFRPPSDPVAETLYELVEKRGENPFIKISIPEAVIKFKQGFGRLIRSKTDRGVVAVLDKRIIEKEYGKNFTASLPVKKNQWENLTRQAVLFETERFFLKNGL